MFHFACLGDSEKVVNGGSWVEKSVVMAPYVDSPNLIELNTLLIRDGAALVPLESADPNDFW
jgi:hypothetical protein